MKKDPTKVYATHGDKEQLLGVKDSRALKILKELAVVKTSSGKMFLPGGKIEDGESTEDCVVRECLEEMGAKVTVKQYFAIGERLFPDTIECLKKLHRYYKIGIIANQSLGSKAGQAYF